MILLHTFRLNLISVFITLRRLLTIETKFEEILQRNEWKLVQKVPFVSVERMIDNDDHRLYFRYRNIKIYHSYHFKFLL